MKMYCKTFLLLTLGICLAETNNPTTEKKACECSKQETARASLLSGETASVYFLVTGMSCGGCSSGLTEKLKALKGVEVNKVSHETASAQLTYKTGETSPTAIISAIEKAGYAVAGEKVSLKVTGMSCGGCESGLTSMLKKLEGVKSVEKACHKTSSVELTTLAHACKDTILKKIQEAGYKAAL